MYPDGFATVIDPGPIAERLEGAICPGHFNGVATVVANLLLQSMLDAVIFGEKDYQQLLVIRRVILDLDIPTEIVGVPIVLAEDGLALSSRNLYLSAAERQHATALPHILHQTAAQILQGDAIEMTWEGAKLRLAAAGFAVDFVDLADAITLAPVRTPGSAARLLVAVRLGSGSLDRQLCH
jgi:pantoate--beta-alanine ligase